MSPVRHAGFAPHVAPDTRLLILGSLPGARSLAERQYHAHPTNQFWRLVGAVIGRRQLPVPYSVDVIDLPSSSAANTSGYATKLEQWLRLRIALKA